MRLSGGYTRLRFLGSFQFLLIAFAVLSALLAGLLIALYPFVSTLAFVAGSILLALIALTVMIPDSWVAVSSLWFVTALAVAVPIFAMSSVRFASLTLVTLLALIIDTLAILTVIRCGLGTILRGGRTTVFVAVFFLILAICSLVQGSPNLQEAIVARGTFWSMWASAFVLALYVPPRLVRTVLISWIVLAFGEAVYAVYEYLASLDPLYISYLLPNLQELQISESNGTLLRARGTFGHSIPLASFLVASFALALWAVRFPTKRDLNLVQLAILAVVAIGVAVTFSRSAWIALFVTIVAGLVFHRTSNLRKWRIIALCSALGAILFFSPLGSYAFGHAQNLINTASFEQRANSLQSIPELLSMEPLTVLFGWGVNADQELFSEGVLQQAEGAPRVVDNQYIVLFIEVGLLGLGAFVAMLWAAFRVRWQRVSAVLGMADSKETISGIKIALLSVLCSIFFYDGLLVPPTAILFWSMLGFLARQDERAPFSIGSSRRKV
jgi:O-antigen ligase